MCLFQTANESVDHAIQLQCKPSCQYRTYDIVATESSWSKDKKHLDIHTVLKTKPNNTLYNQQYNRVDDDSVPNFIRDNFLRINVYFGDFVIQEKEIVLDFDWYALLSNIGGAFGFCVGISLLTILEVIEMIMDVLWCVWTSRRKKMTDTK